MDIRDWKGKQKAYLRQAPQDWSEPLLDFLTKLYGSRRDEDTIRFYACQIKQMALWAGKEEIALKDFKARNFRHYMAYRADQVSVRTQLHDAVAAKVFFRFCKEEDYSPHDVLKDYEFPKPPDPVVRMPEAEELRKLLQAVHARWDVRENPAIRRQDASTRPFFSARDYAIISLLIDTGARISEILNLQLADLDTERLEVTFNQRKTKDNLTVPVSAEVIADIRPWLKIRERIEREKKGDIARGVAPRCGTHLFITVSGELLRPTTFGRSFRAYLAFAGLERFTRHGIRHHTITEMVAINPRSAQIMAGHASIETTIAKYDRTKAATVRADHAAASPFAKLMVNKRSEQQKHAKRRKVM